MDATIDPKAECICGWDTSPNGARFDVVCPKCDGVAIVEAPVKFIAITIECGGITKLVDPKLSVDIGEACGPHLVVDPCPVCGDYHRIDTPQFRSYTG